MSARHTATLPSLPLCLTSTLRWTLAALLLTSLGACQKLTEVATEKAAEKMIESQTNQDGSQAKVDIGSGGVKVEGKDENGKAFKMEMGSAQISEKEMTLPFYPGAKPVENKGTRMINGELSMWQLELASSDAPKKVAAWYRDQLKARGEGKLVMDQSREDGMMLSISDSKTDESVMVDISAAEGGSTISLMHSVKGAAPQ